MSEGFNRVDPPTNHIEETEVGPDTQATLKEINGKSSAPKAVKTNLIAGPL